MKDEVGYRAKKLKRAKKSGDPEKVGKAYRKLKSVKRAALAELKKAARQ